MKFELQLHRSKHLLDHIALLGRVLFHALVSEKRFELVDLATLVVLRQTFGSETAFSKAPNFVKSAKQSTTADDGPSFRINLPQI